MANSKSAEKRARQAADHRARNVAHRSTVRSAIKKVVNAIAEGKQDAAAAELKAATPIIDSMVNKGIIHRNKADRHKSRLSSAVKALAK